MTRHPEALKRLLLIGVIAGVVSACGAEDPEDVKLNAVSFGRARDKIVNDRVTEVTLSDGTKCVVFYGGAAGNITCHWKP